MDIFKNDDDKKELLEIFQNEYETIYERIFENLLKLEKNPSDKDIVLNLYRDFHGIKGAVRMVGYSNIQQIYHKIEDIFDYIKTNDIKLENSDIDFLFKAIELANNYVQDSLKNKREVIDAGYTSIISSLEYLCEVTLPEHAMSVPVQAPSEVNEQVSKDLSGKLEEINLSFNTCFEIIDSIVPEEEFSDIVILKEEVQKIFDILKDENLYEVKTLLQDVLVKLDFVMNATSTFTISEILELRNSLSSAAGTFNTMLKSVESSETTFFDVAEKVVMLQSSCVHAEEIKNDILKLKAEHGTPENDEIIDIIVEILDFISQNSVQLEEQMVQTLKSGLEYCAAPNENFDADLILQQLEIMKQLLELTYKKDVGVTEIKNLTTQNVQAGGSASNEIKTMHVNAQKLDLLVNQLGELIITKIKTEKNLDKIELIKNANEACQKDLLKTYNYLRYYNRKYLQNSIGDKYMETFVKQIISVFSEIAQNLSHTIYDLTSLYRASKEDNMKMRLIIDEMESMVKNIRVLPISTVFNSFTRMVRDIATEKGKDVDFEIEGNDTCADKKIIEEIKTPLIHILRNAIDHGIETKEERINVGKSPIGKILLSAKQCDNMVVIDVMDDGQGFNLQKIKERAVSRGFLTQEEVNSMTDDAIMNIIFWPGFTTGDSITSISGRGIGLDVVKTKISQLNGKVSIISEFGKGSCVHIEIPVTLTTLRVFLVEISKQIFAIPIQVITTFILKNQDEIMTNNETRSVLYNNEIVPIHYLSNILGLSLTERTGKETILIVESDGQKMGLVVDKLLGDQDILQKKLSAPLYKVKNISGVTNLATGELCLVLNMQDIIKHDFSKISSDMSSQNLLSYESHYTRILVVDDSMTTRAMLKNILSNIGYGVDTVNDVTEALVKLKLNHYDLIITDLSMEKINGYEFIEHLNNDVMYKDIPIWVVSSDKEFHNDGRYKVEGFLCKNDFNQERFIQLIRESIKKHYK